MHEDTLRRLNFRKWSELSDFERNEIEEAMTAAKVGTHWCNSYWWSRGNGPLSVGGWDAHNPKPAMVPM